MNVVQRDGESQDKHVTELSGLDLVVLAASPIGSRGNINQYGSRRDSYRRRKGRWARVHVRVTRGRDAELVSLEPVNVIAA